jgi:hypothetical protein
MSASLTCLAYSYLLRNARVDTASTIHFSTYWVARVEIGPVLGQAEQDFACMELDALTRGNALCHVTDIRSKALRREAKEWVASNARTLVYEDILTICNSPCPSP